MAATQRQQSNVMLYTLVTFIALTIILITFSVIYYIKFEEQRTIADNAKTELEKVATPSEMLKGLTQIVGIIPSRSSGLGVMNELLNKLVTLITGGPLADTSATIKVDNALQKVQETIKPLFGKYLKEEFNDPNNVSLARIITVLGETLKNNEDLMLDLQQRHEQLKADFNSSTQVHLETEKQLETKLSEYQQQVNTIKVDYARLEELLKQTTEQQVQTLRDELKTVKAKNEDLRDELLKMQASYKLTEDKLKLAQAQIEKIQPQPDSNAIAYKPDGKIIFVDTQSKIVHIDIGSDDHVYRGLTFAVYDRTLPVPKSGEGKAEIEVFDVGKNTSAARITTPLNIRNPVITGDVIANLIWDKNETNIFVVAGDFEYADTEKIKSLIQKWGGRADENVTIETDFVVLGIAPKILPKPTPEQIDLYPGIQEKFEASRKRYEHYIIIEQQARALSIPIFNTERFLYFIGYKEQAGKAGAF